jgi:hypothetical protein
MGLHAHSSGGCLSALGFALADPLEGVQINQHIGQGIVIGN